jgi:hypothetical protein
VRIAVLVLGALLLLTVAGIWFAFPQSIRDQFTFLQRATVVLFGVAAMVCGYALARSRVEARPESVTVVNGYRSRRLEWSQVVSVTLRQGSPWATADLADGTTTAVMGIQGSDGSRAIQAIRQLRLLVAERSSADGDGG